MCNRLIFYNNKYHPHIYKTQKDVKKKKEDLDRKNFLNQVLL